MTTNILKSKYEITEIIKEDIFTFLLLGKSLITGKQIYIWKYKHEYLKANDIRKLIKLSEILIQIKHQHILNLEDYFYDGMDFYTIHEGSAELTVLEDHIKNQKALDFKLLWNWITQIVSGLVELELYGLAHGYLNLNSIMIDKNNNIILTKAALTAPIIETHFKEFQVIEECMFLAPEIIQRQEVSNKADIYSLGVLMYIFFSQKWPYKYTNKVAQYKKFLLKKPAPFEAISNKIPEKIKQIISICLNRDPHLRFNTCLDLVKSYQENRMIDLLNKKAEKSEIKEEIKKEILYGKLKVAFLGFKVVFVIISFASILFASHFLYINYITAIPDKVVPDVTGLEYDKAVVLLKEYGLKSKVAGHRIHSSIDQGSVIESKPPSGREVKQNRVVRLFLSKGIGKALVPDLVGRSLQKGESLANNFKLNIEVASKEYSLKEPKDIILSQTPTPNFFMSTSENIVVTISKGYPINYSIEAVDPWLFQNKETMRKVSVRLLLLEEWPEQDILISYHIDDQKEELFVGKLLSGENKEFVYELEAEGTLEIYFNEELARTIKLKNLRSFEEDEKENDI